VELRRLYGGGGSHSVTSRGKKGKLDTDGTTQDESASLSSCDERDSGMEDEQGL